MDLKEQLKGVGTIPLCGDGIVVSAATRPIFSVEGSPATLLDELKINMQLTISSLVLTKVHSTKVTIGLERNGFGTGMGQKQYQSVQMI